MLDFQEKKRVRKALYSWPMIAGLLVALALLVHATWDVYGKYTDTAQKEDVAKRQAAGLSEQAGQLTADISRLSTEQGKEEEIRTKYGFTKPGEGVIVIVDDSSTQTATSTPSSAWSRFWQAVKSAF